MSLITKTAFNVPIENALKAGIPVVAYNADAPSPPNKRLAYIGQDLKLAGELMGKRIVAAVGSGDVVIFTANAGSANLQPRLEGAEKAIKESGAPIKLHHDRRPAPWNRARKRRSKPIGPAIRPRRGCTPSTAATPRNWRA